MKVFFEESQSIRNHGWIWLLIIVPIAAALIPLGIGMKQQLVDNIPWGNKPLSNGMMIFLCLFVASAGGIVVWLIYTARIDLRIDAEGVHYKFYPYHPKWTSIPTVEIKGYEVRRLRWNEVSKRVRDVRKHIRFKSLSSPEVLIIKLSNDKELVIGTNNPQSVDWAMKRLLSMEKVH